MARQQSRSQRTRSEAAFEALLSSAQAMLLVDPDGRVVRLNRPLGGRAPADTVGLPVDDLVADSHQQAMRAAIRHAFHPGLGQTLDAPVAGHGRDRWYRFHITPWNGEDGREAAFVHCTDIHAEHQEIERLAAAERLMRDTEGMSHLGTWTWDITQPHAVWSSELYRIYGLDPESHTPTYDDYLERVHPDDRDRVREATEAVFQDQQPYSHDERILRADGTWRHLHTWARPVVDGQGELKALHGVCLDITDRKEAELALASSEGRQKAILEAAGLGIASLRPDGVIEDANPAFQELLGAAEPPCPLWPMLPERSVEEAKQVVKEVLARGGTQQILLSYDDERRLRLIATAAHDDASPFIVALVQDVSAEHAASAARRRIEQLEARRIQQARLVGVASHEMKNPLTPIVLQLDLLRKGHAGDLSEAQEGALDSIRRQTDQLRSRLHELLEASRAEEGRLQVTPAPCDLAAVVRDAAAAHGAEAEDLGIDLRIDVPESLDAELDGGRIAQVVDNLVANALRFTPSGRAVDVQLSVDGDATIVVRDEGVGIAGGDDLFAAFADGGQGVHPGRSHGLGLYIVQAIVKAHGGSIDVESEPGEGTCFTVRLPLST